MYINFRIIPSRLGVFYFSYGLCRHIGPLACFIIYSFMLACYKYIYWILLFSFFYRYYSMSASLGPKTVKIVILLIFIPSFLQFVVYCLAFDTEATIKARIEGVFGYDTKDECAISYQAIIPIFHIFGLLVFTLGYLEILHHPILEYLPYVFIDFVPVLTPLTSLFLMVPYRSWLKQVVCKVKDLI
ncbi:hypothetical protein OESDEN_14813 [Oesophagostomum dentatum]|uniref:Uncharacterized protein n=1 Tax=Oesophagostomum dentatum TaxID=61180 RepID=A0A0B1SKK4_OESDE|nr:hypothetical protein OESDEN_14813 [Oesophagostomum dentatum]